MRCSQAQKKMAGLAPVDRLRLESGLSSHLDGCALCRAALSSHEALLELLDAPRPLPGFRDISPLVASRLDHRQPRLIVSLRWAAAACLVCFALAVGYVLGRPVGEAAVPVRTSQTAAYGEALDGISSASLTTAYFESVPAASQALFREPRP
ncbi:MAG: hypothetical protein P8Z49_10340 [Acidobacteriota bacterium]|jgi:hypothetical protein